MGIAYIFYTDWRYFLSTILIFQRITSLHWSTTTQSAKRWTYLSTPPNPYPRARHNRRQVVDDVPPRRKRQPRQPNNLNWWNLPWMVSCSTRRRHNFRLTNCLRSAWQTWRLLTKVWLIWIHRRSIINPLHVSFTLHSSALQLKLSLLSLLYFELIW